MSLVGVRGTIKGAILATRERVTGWCRPTCPRPLSILPVSSLLVALSLAGNILLVVCQRQDAGLPATGRLASDELAGLAKRGAATRSGGLEASNPEQLGALVLKATGRLARQAGPTAETIFGPGHHIKTDDGGPLASLDYCSVNFATRTRILKAVPNNRTKSPTKITESVVERVLVCSQLDEGAYQEMGKTIDPKANLSIQQIHILASEPSLVSMAVDLICNRLDCSTLTVFNVSGHEMHDLNKIPIQLGSWPHLEVLDMTGTSLKSFEAILPVDASRRPTIAKNLTQLHLDSNRLSELDFDLIFARLPNLRHLSVANNSIFNILCNESLRARVVRQFDHINLAGNVINCNKTTQMWLLKQIQSPLTSSIFQDYDRINCTMSNLNEMTWAQRVSVLETDICDICDCHSAKKTALQVDCRNKSLTKLPDVLPLNTRILNLTMNHITSLGVPENAKNWENVTYVHLEDNLISSFQQLELNSKFIRNLVALDIRRNKFQEFPSHILEQFVNLDQVHLSDNPWLCDCDSTFAFQEWLQRQFHKVGDKEEIRCGMSGQDINGLKSNSLQQRLSSRVIYKLSKSELCPQDTLERPIDWLDIVNITFGLTIVLILVKVLMDYIYQHRTKRLPHFFQLNF